MTLFEKATELQLRLESVSATDAGDELLSRGKILRQELIASAEHFEAVLSYRTELGTMERIPLDGKDVRQAIGRFRAAMSTNGPRAFQQQSAQTLLDVLKMQSKHVDRWVKSKWTANFDPAQDLLARVDSGSTHRITSAEVQSQGPRSEDLGGYEHGSGP